MLILLKIVELMFLTNFLTILLTVRHKKLPRKLGMIMLLVGLLWVLVLIFQLEPQSLFIFNIVSRNFIWAAFSIDKLSFYFCVMVFFLTLICISLYNSRNYNQLVYLMVFFLMGFFLFHVFSSLN